MDALKEARDLRNEGLMSDKEFERLRRAHISSLEKRILRPEAARVKRRKVASAPQEPALKKVKKEEEDNGTKKKAIAPTNCGSSSRTQHLALVGRDGFTQQQSTSAGCRLQSDPDGNPNGVERAAAPVAGAGAGKGLNESSIPNMRRITALLSNCCDEPGKSCAESEDAPPASASETETAGKSKKKPKRALSAYTFFLIQKRGEVKEKCPELDNTAAMKQLGIMWKEASDAVKAPFEAMANQDKKRYEEEMKQYAKEKEPAAAAASGEDDSEDRHWQPWSVEEDQTFIQAHREGKLYREIAAMLPGRTNRAVRGRLDNAKKGTHGTAPLLAYAAECLQR